ncbi:MAG: hypothetical protein WC842_04340 [Candidatus Paceibacterota bacterium]|jgi:hypothetical protein
MSEKRLYLYDAENKEWSLRGLKRSGAILTVPLQSFQSTMGCAQGISAHILSRENIGKKFELSILDPVKIGRVEFLGSVTIKGNKCIPNFIYEKMKEENFFLCAIGDDPEKFFAFRKSKEFIVVNKKFCDVISLF